MISGLSEFFTAIKVASPAKPFNPRTRNDPKMGSLQSNIRLGTSLEGNAAVFIITNFSILSDWLLNADNPIAPPQS